MAVPPSFLSQRAASGALSSAPSQARSRQHSRPARRGSQCTQASSHPGASVSSSGIHTEYKPSFFFLDISVTKDMFGNVQVMGGKELWKFANS